MSHYAENQVEAAAKCEAEFRKTIKRNATERQRFDHLLKLSAQHGIAYKAFNWLEKRLVTEEYADQENSEFGA